jgi:hypothetical protein
VGMKRRGSSQRFQGEGREHRVRRMDAAAQCLARRNGLSFDVALSRVHNSSVVLFLREGRNPSSRLPNFSQFVESILGVALLSTFGFTQGREDAKAREVKH